MNRIKKKKFWRRSYNNIVLPTINIKQTKINIRMTRKEFLKLNETSEILVEHSMIKDYIKHPKRYNYYIKVNVPFLPIYLNLKFLDINKIRINTVTMEHLNKILKEIFQYSYFTKNEIPAILKINIPLVNNYLKKLRKKRR